MPEIEIHTPDGKVRQVPLQGDRVTLGRSTSADLCYPDDGGLSRLHMAFERTAAGFVVRDLKSKNGTIVNGRRATEVYPLKPNDRITGGHLLIVFEPGRKPATPAAVVFVEEDQNGTDSTTIVTSLVGVLKGDAQQDGKRATGAPAQVSALIRAGNELASERPLPELFRYILTLAMDTLGAGRGVLLTIENGMLVEQAARGHNLKISTAVRDRVLGSKLSILVRDTRLDESFNMRESLIMANVRTLMAAPLQVRDQVVGLLYLDTAPMGREFTRDDLDLLTVMANVAAIRIEQSRMAELEQTRRLLERDLEQAEEIQRGALPAHAPDVAGLDIAGHNAPARTVGGDYYDFFPDAQGRVAILVADVSGKGMPAALMVMALQARVQPLFEVLPVDPGALRAATERANRLTTANCLPGMFITVFACVLDGRTGRLDWCCAGHNPPLLVRADGSYQLLRGGGPLMGMFADAEYPQFSAQLQPGDLIAIYSDGITESFSPDDEDFDTALLARVLAENRTKTSGELVDCVMDRVRQWTHGAPQMDDITLVIAKRRV